MRLLPLFAGLAVSMTFAAAGWKPRARRWRSVTWPCWP
jgi:hypothetical protein